MKKDVAKNISLFHTREELIINTHKLKESDKSSENKNVINNLFLETLMEDTTYKQFETEYNGFKVIVEFPSKSEHEDSIHGEVKQLMSNLLHEQLTQII